MSILHHRYPVGKLKGKLGIVHHGYDRSAAFTKRYDKVVYFKLVPEIKVGHRLVKKDNVWKKPDYQAMLDDGVPLGVAYFIKKARDSLGASPQYRYSDTTPERRRARQEEYI